MRDDHLAVPGSRAGEAVGEARRGEDGGDHALAESVGESGVDEDVEGGVEVAASGATEAEATVAQRRHQAVGGPRTGGE